MSNSIAGEWTLAQSNGYTVKMTIFPQDNGGYLGNAEVVGGGPHMIATADDLSFNGVGLSFKVKWPNGGAIGQYIGQYDGSGNLTGVTFDVAHPNSQATWFRQFGG